MKTIVIIGAGAAGLSAALESVQQGASVILVSSQPSERSQSVMAEGGINAVMDMENDSFREHYEDTVRAGCGIADPDAVWDMVNAAPDLVRNLYHLGTQFNVFGIDQMSLRSMGGQKKKRTVFARTDTGKQIMTALTDAVRKYEAEGKIQRLCHHCLETLLMKNDICYGCVIKDVYTGKVQMLPASAVIMASGGMNGLFGNTTGTGDNTGEAAAELFRLGIPFANLEMIQYHPTTIPANGKHILISEAARAEGARLFTDRDNGRWYFMEEKYPETGNLTTRDITSREIWQIEKESRVYLDMTDIPAKKFDERFSNISEICSLYLHKDPARKPIPVEPGIHYFMGGIFVNRHHETPVRHLYAAGECCAQYHGANRLGGNSLLGALYGGKTAAKYAANEPEEIQRPVFSFPRQIQKQTIHEQTLLQQIMRSSMGIIRNEEMLRKGLDEISEIKGNMPLLGKAVLKSALARKESRGAHYREDYPQKDDLHYRKTTLVQYAENDIQVSFLPVKERKTE